VLLKKQECCAEGEAGTHCRIGPRPICCRRSWETMWDAVSSCDAARWNGAAVPELADSLRARLDAGGRRGMPVPRTAFGLNDGLKTEFFATRDWTGRPVATTTEPAVQTDWENALR